MREESSYLAEMTRVKDPFADSSVLHCSDTRVAKPEPPIKLAPCRALIQGREDGQSGVTKGESE